MSARDMAGSTSAKSGTDARPAKRNRITVACTWCRQRKSRLEKGLKSCEIYTENCRNNCDGLRPTCSTCSEHGNDCVYSADTTSLTKTSASKELFDAIELRLARLESSVATLDNRVTCIETPNIDPLAAETNLSQSTGHSLLASDTFGGEAVDGNMLSARDPTDGIGSIVFTKEEQSGFFGPSSNIALTRQIVRTTTEILQSIVSASGPNTQSHASLEGFMLHMSRQQSPVLDQTSPQVDPRKAAEPFALPPKRETLQMIERFFATTGVLFPYLDKEAFLNMYQQLASNSVRTTRRSWLALLNMVLAMATHAGHDNVLPAPETATRSNVYFQRALALCEADIRYAASLEIVQLLLLMSQYLQGTERSIETWNVHGLAVKAAYQLGLHSPNALQQYSEPEREFRKRTWYGCVLLDRSFSMTLGRPPSIPQSFVRLDLPCALTSSESSSPVSSHLVFDRESVQFYTATITLYTIMGEVIEVLYDSNLGCGSTSNIFHTASHLMRFEQRYLDWQRLLPAELSLVQPDHLRSTTADQNTLRLRFILTARFLNLRILTHRPILCRYLEILGKARLDFGQLNTLRQVGANSIRICAESALDIIRMMHEVLTHPDPPRHLLGAWWFSLYYTFNAALIIYATLLVQHQASVHGQVFIIEQTELTMDHLYLAIECLSLLFKGNRMTEKCVRYTSSLASTLSAIINPDNSQGIQALLNLPTDSLGGSLATQVSDKLPSHDIFAFQDSSDLHMGLSLDDFLGTDLNYFTNSRPHEI